MSLTLRQGARQARRRSPQRRQACAAKALPAGLLNPGRARCRAGPAAAMLLPAPAPVAFGRAAAQTQRPGPLWGLLKPPLPTNAWWQNLVLGDGDQPVAPYPYFAAAMGHVSCCSPRKTSELPAPRLQPELDCLAVRKPADPSWPCA